MRPPSGAIGRNRAQSAQSAQSAPPPAHRRTAVSPDTIHTLPSHGCRATHATLARGPARRSAEPTTVPDYLDIDYEERKGWTGFLLTAAFGFFVVVLLLNLLIAVFAKSVDQVTQDLDSHFKLKFGQVVMKATRMGLAPRPLNVIRRIILICYDLGGALCECGFEFSHEPLHLALVAGSKQSPPKPKPRRPSITPGLRVHRFSLGRASQRQAQSTAKLLEAWGEDKSREGLNEKSEPQKSADFVERALSAEVRRLHAVTHRYSPFHCISLRCVPLYTVARTVGYRYVPFTPCR